MLKLNQKKLSYTFDRCQQCGICYAVCPENAISLSLRHDGLHDIKINAALCIACGKCVRSCPANKEYGYEGYFDGFAQKKYYLGYHADNLTTHSPAVIMEGWLDAVTEVSEISSLIPNP